MRRAASQGSIEPAPPEAHAHWVGLDNGLTLALTSNAGSLAVETGNAADAEAMFRSSMDSAARRADERMRSTRPDVT